MSTQSAISLPDRTSQRVTLLREISSSPISAMFAAEQTSVSGSRLVAAKLLKRRKARDLEQLVQIRESGRRLLRINHPSATSATDLAVIEGQPALISPWIEGMDLLDWIEVLRETNRTLPVRAVCEILRSAAAALDAAAMRAPWGDSEPLQLMHRDVKPANLMISRDGEVKLLDFGMGLTVLAGRDARQLAFEKGVSRYLSPGRRVGKRGSGASDVYALGLIGVEALSGRWLQRVRDTNPAHDRHLAEVVAELPAMDLRSQDDDRTLRALLLRMVAYDPEARPSASEASQTLRALADRCPGPSLLSFAHENQSISWVAPPESRDGLPEGLIVEPDTLESLVRAEPDDGYAELPAIDAGTEESVWVPASLIEELDDSRDPSVDPSLTPKPIRTPLGASPIVAVPSPSPAPPRSMSPSASVPAAPPRESIPAMAAPVVAGAVGSMVIAAGTSGLMLGVAIGVVVGTFL